ncbi:MAG: sialidase family protein [Planctomycetota bacterium]|jgi:hypothetical protein
MRSIGFIAIALAAAVVLGGAEQGWAQDASRGAVSITPASGAAQPDVAVSADGAVVWVVYGGAREGRGNVFVVRSDDGGASFGEPVVAIDAGGRGRFGRQRGPRIGVDGDGTVYVSAAVQLEAIDPAPRYPKADIWLAVSTDGGKTFGKPRKVNDAGKTATESMHDLAVTPKGEAHLVWLDNRTKKGNQLWYTRVTKRGTKVERNRLAYGSPEGGVCPCCTPAVTVDAKGNPIAAFRNNLGGKRDAWVAVSRNKGKSFAAAKAGQGGWEANS